MALRLGAARQYRNLDRRIACDCGLGANVQPRKMDLKRRQGCPVRVDDHPRAQSFKPAPVFSADRRPAEEKGIAQGVEFVPPGRDVVLPLADHLFKLLILCGIALGLRALVTLGPYLCAERAYPQLVTESGVVIGGESIGPRGLVLQLPLFLFELLL
jgi:hypothetical protein